MIAVAAHPSSRELNAVYPPCGRRIKVRGRRIKVRSVHVFFHGGDPLPTRKSRVAHRPQVICADAWLSMV